MNIILIRHGLAQEHSAATPDTDRQLVSRGVKRTRKAALVLKDRLKAGRPVVLLSSPAARTVQTAEVIAKTLGLGGIDGIHACIYTGNTEELLRVLAVQPWRSTVLVVGHEPDLSRWALLFGGKALRFKKSGMAGLSVRKAGLPHARLRWTHRVQRAGQSKERTLGEPEPADVGSKVLFTVGSFQRIMQERVQAIAEARQSFLEQPESDRTVHQLRVTVRQARSLLSFMRPALEGRALRKSQDSLRRMARSLSRIRELDVFEGQWRDLCEQQAGQESCHQLDHAISQERQKELDVALPSIQTPNAEEALLAVLHWVGGWNQKWGQDTSLAKLARKRLEAWHTDIRKGLDTLDVQNLPRTHALRLRIKKTRYAQESIPLLQGRPGPNPEQLKELQDDLGEICDAHAHQDLLAELTSRYPIPQDNPLIAQFFQHLETIREKHTTKVQADTAATFREE